MANLIPPDAKKAIVTEYWFRVLIMWFILTGLGLLFVAVLQVPTFMLLQSHAKSFNDAYNETQEKVDGFKDGEKSIDDANKLAKLLSAQAESTPLSEVMEILDEVAGNDIAITDMDFKKNENVLSEINVRGVALSREALAGFSTDIEEHSLFETAELPFSNLAKDKDISFNITVVAALPNKE